MNKSSSFRERIGVMLRRFGGNKRRLTGISLTALGVCLAAISRITGGSPFQDFSSGLMMGLSVGMLFAGILVTLFSFRR